MKVEERLDKLERQVADLRARLLGVAEYCARVLGQAPPKPPPGAETETLSLSDDFTDRKPVAYSFLDERHEVSAFREILRGICGTVHDRHRADFQRTLRLSGFAKDPQGLGKTSRPWEIGHSGIHVATNRCANDLMAKCRELIELYGHAASDVEVEVRAR